MVLPLPGFPAPAPLPSVGVVVGTGGDTTDEPPTGCPPPGVVVVLPPTGAVPTPGPESGPPTIDVVVGAGPVATLATGGCDFFFEPPTPPPIAAARMTMKTMKAMIMPFVVRYQGWAFGGFPKVGEVERPGLFNRPASGSVGWESCLDGVGGFSVRTAASYPPCSCPFVTGTEAARLES